MKHRVYAGIFGMAVMDALWLGGTHVPWYGVVLIGLASGIVYVEICSLWHRLWEKND